MVSPSNHVLLCLGCHVSTPCSGVSYIDEAHICISVITFFHYRYFIQEHILLIVHIVKSIICRVYSVRIRHVIIHNALYMYLTFNVYTHSLFR